MNTAQRRTEILKLLQQAEKPVAARAMASQFGVSRQVIVQDMAVIRASTPGILSTTRGYVLQQDKDIACTREFKVRHGQEKAAEELNLIVDCGGRVKNISISHRVYGRVTAEMDIRSRQDVNEFVQAINSSHSSVLSSATSGYHYHLIEASSQERLDLIGEQLKKAGFLAPLQPWEKEKRNNIEGIQKMTIAEIQQEILRNEKRTGYLYSCTRISGSGDSGSGGLYRRFLWPECTGIQKRLQRCDHVRRSFYGRNLQDFKPEEESMAC